MGYAFGFIPSDLAGRPGVQSLQVLSETPTVFAKYSTINQKLGDSKRATGGKTGGRYPGNSGFN